MSYLYIVVLYDEKYPFMVLKSIPILDFVFHNRYFINFPMNIYSYTWINV